jgi:hypothetical protein
MKKIWANFSIFVSLSNSHYIFSVIREFLEEFKSLNINEYALRFNTDGGNNIQFAVLIHEKQIEYYVGFISDRIEATFTSNALKVLSPLPKEKMFMDQYINTLHFGLFDPNKTIQLSDIKIETALADGLINALRNEIVDEELIVTYGYYIHVILISTYLKYFNKPISHEILKYYLQDSGDNPFLGSLVNSKRFQENKELLTEIKRDIFNSTYFEYNPWIKSLIEAFNHEFNKYKFNGDDNSEGEAFGLLNLKIKRQLATGSTFNKIVDSFILNSFTGYLTLPVESV